VAASSRGRGGAATVTAGAAVLVYTGAVAMGPVDRLVHLGPDDSTSFTADVPHRYVVENADDVAATLLVRYPRYQSGLAKARPAPDSGGRRDLD